MLSAENNKSIKAAAILLLAGCFIRIALYVSAIIVIGFSKEFPNSFFENIVNLEFSSADNSALFILNIIEFIAGSALAICLFLNKTQSAGICIIAAGSSMILYNILSIIFYLTLEKYSNNNVTQIISYIMNTFLYALFIILGIIMIGKFKKITVTFGNTMVAVLRLFIVLIVVALFNFLKSNSDFSQSNDISFTVAAYLYDLRLYLYPVFLFVSLSVVCSNLVKKIRLRAE